LVKAGNYDNNDPLNRLRISVSGTASAPITLLGENRPRLSTVKITNSKYFILDGFEIANKTSNELFSGVSLSGSRNIIIRNMVIHHLTGNGFGFDTDNSDILIERSKIYELVPRRTGTGAHCFFNTSSKNLTIRKNECHDYIGDGFQAGRADNSVLYNRGTTIFEGNLFYNSPQKAPCAENAIDIKAESGKVIIRGNIMYGYQPLTGQGCTLQASGDPVGTAITTHQDSNGVLIIEGNEFYNMYAAVSNNDMDTTIRNNIFHDFKEGFPLWSQNKHIGAILANGKSKIYHNTFVSVPFIFHEYASGGQKVINNLFYNITGNNRQGAINGTYKSNSWFKVHASQRVSGTGDLTGDPAIDLNSGNNMPDYTLAANSQLVNKAQTGLGVTTDFTAVPDIRVRNSPPDIGAFEYNGGSSAAVLASVSGEIVTFDDLAAFTNISAELAIPDPEEPAVDTTILTLDGPTSAAPGETFSLSLQAQGLTGNGLYGAQLDINYDPALVSVNNLQLNPDLPFVVLNSADNTAGKIRVVASRQGNVPGLTGDITLLTFEVTTLAAGTATFAFENVKLGDSQATALEVTPQNYALDIAEPEPEPTDEPTPEPTDEPQPTDEPTPQPTDEPTSEPTDQPTPEPTDPPTPQPTDEPTPEPTDEPTPQPTGEPTPEPTDEPTPEPTDEPTPQPTGEPNTTTLMGQVILAGRAESNWSGASVSVEDSGQSATTDATGLFALVNVTPGAHSSVTADAPGYLPAVCTAPNFVGAEVGLTPVTLLSGDINDDSLVDVTDATTVGVSFGNSGPDLPADINQDSLVDIFDIILVSVNFGQGPQVWNCLAQ
jgi:hypothetical protein